MKKILITGGAGYIGSMLSTRLIEKGYQVTVVDLLKYDKGSLNHLYFNENFKFSIFRHSLISSSNILM